MGRALIEAAAEAGIRITLLDACYLSGGLGPHGHRPLTRLSAGSRRRRRRPGLSGSAGCARNPASRDRWRAIHSVRAVPRERARHRRRGCDQGRPLHVHLSEQPAENEQC